MGYLSKYYSWMDYNTFPKFSQKSLFIYYYYSERINAEYYYFLIVKKSGNKTFALIILGR